jgi:hypothetical protein
MPFSLDLEALAKQAHLESGSDDEAEFRMLADLAVRVGKPKAAYAVAFVERRDGDNVQIGDVVFTSRTLRRNLESVERVFPLIATCGREMDAAFPAKGDMLKEFWWELIKAQLLSAANRQLDDHLSRRFRLAKTATMRPGSGDATIWPIEQQRQLFALLGDVEKAIGVRLTDSFLMIPNKTTSGILFPTEKDFRTCEVCHRENCPSRHAPFNQQLWEEIERAGGN